MNQNILLKNQVAEIQGKLDAEKAWWGERRAGIQSDFMKELESDGKPVEATVQRKTGSDDDVVIVESGGLEQDQGGAGKKKKAKQKGGAA